MFSGAVKIADLDDYILPSQNCIKPLLDSINQSEVTENSQDQFLIKSNPKQSRKVKLDTNEDNSMNIKNNVINIEIQPNLIKTKNATSTAAKVNLYDCLACSGCVTTAETLLMEQQSVEEFLKNCMSKMYKVAVTVSPQTVLSTAKHYGISNEECFKRLLKLLSSINVKYVFSYDFGVELSLNKVYEEFKQRVIGKEGNLSSFIMASECPGWICYAEKKVGDWVQEHLSKIKSPQQLMGHIIKLIVPLISDESLQTSLPVYHCVIMPCFDKKLESTRKENTLQIQGGLTPVKEVDNVISTAELKNLLSLVEFDFTQPADEIPNIYCSLSDAILSYMDKGEIYLKNIQKSDLTQFFIQNSNFSSNGYSTYIMNRYIADYKPLNYQVKQKSIKNSDFQEITLEIEGKPSIHFALVYGFRNIQTILRKKKEHKYNYIEIMACPGGCLNGGAQFKPDGEDETSRTLLAKLEKSVVNSIQNTTNLDLLKGLEQSILKLVNYTEETNNPENSLYKADFKAVKETILTSLKW